MPKQCPFLYNYGLVISPSGCRYSTGLYRGIGGSNIYTIWIKGLVALWHYYKNMALVGYSFLIREYPYGESIESNICQIKGDRGYNAL